MDKVRIPYAEINRLPALANRVIEGDPSLKEFYRPFGVTPDPAQLTAQQQRLGVDARKTLVSVIKDQYKGIDNPPNAQIESLSLSNGFTITTGHQLNLFTGPLYFLYKIIDTIKIAKQWNAQQDGNNYVAVYWMASEDHDFEEINHFSVHGQKIHWSAKEGGAVGRYATKGLDQVLKIWEKHLGKSPEAAQLTTWFQKAYVEHETLGAATRCLVHQLFGQYGLVVLDADHPKLKKAFVPYILKELVESTTQKETKKTHQALEKSLASPQKQQVFPRDINLFYLEGSHRRRIEKNEGGFRVVDTDQIFSKEAFLEEVKAHPERFSPNALLRPVYQEVILPNLVYVGGGSELAYWLQLRDTFSAFDLPMPMLKLRSSLLIKTKKQQKKAEKWGLQDIDLFLPQNELINHRVRQISNIDIDLGGLKSHLDQQFAFLYDLAQQTDASFLGAVKAQEKKQKKGIDRLEKRLLKAQRKKLIDQVTRISELQQELFPQGILQERVVNFASFYLKYGDDFIPYLVDHIDPMETDFLCITMP